MRCTAVIAIVVGTLGSQDGNAAEDVDEKMSFHP